NSGHSLKQLKSVMLREIATLQNQPVANAELDRIKTQIIAQKTFEKDSLFGQAMELGLLETVGIGWHAKDEYQKNIQAITPEQIQEVAKRYFIPANETEAQLHPINQSENSR
ncbi:MAG TPA: peptidase M16, partial [Legionellales bacterium]|nr:peptidase M16 [Legionellales bacterium]